MTSDRAIEILIGLQDGSGQTYEAILMAIEALKHERTDEWCTDCKEYDMEKKCCPRFNRVIREAMKRIPHDDGTLEVKVDDATKIGRVLISDDKHRGGLYYPDEDEPKGDLISRADAIEAMGEEPLVWCDEEYEIAERDQWRADIEAIESVPPADRPRGEWTLLTEERPVDNYEIITTVYWPGYGDSTIAVGHIDRFDNWHLYSPTEGELIKGFEVIAWKTLPEPYCGADMRGDTK